MPSPFASPYPTPSLMQSISAIYSPIPHLLPFKEKRGCLKMMGLEFLKILE